ncbi:MAG TPA: AI-2E family transporter [Geminicoccaceae bacterium]|nr:AI-2E family transporter [Geminicoccus sp.]HMU52230.1 AI-2E family transporter [Geminicoccaceae bacterium]
MKLERRTVSLTALAVVLVLLLWLAPDALLIVFAGALLGVFLNAGARLVSRLTGIGRSWALAAFALLLAALVVAGTLTALPFLAEQMNELWRQVPQAAAAVRQRMEQYSWSRDLLGQIQPQQMVTAGRSTAGFALSTVFGAFGNLILILFIGLYFASDPGLYRRGVERLVAPSLRPETERVLLAIGHTLEGWLLAQLIAMAVVGVLILLGLWAMGVPLAPVLAVIAALATFVPNIGPVIGAVPAVLLGLADGPWMALWVALLYLAVQTVESYLITPLVQLHTNALPPALVMATQLVLGIMFGLLGLALATPLTAACITLIHLTYVERWLEAGDRRVVT